MYALDHDLTETYLFICSVQAYKTISLQNNHNSAILISLSRKNYKFNYMDF